MDDDYENDFEEDELSISQSQSAVLSTSRSNGQRNEDLPLSKQNSPFPSKASPSRMSVGSGRAPKHRSPKGSEAAKSYMKLGEATDAADPARERLTMLEDKVAYEKTIKELIKVNQALQRQLRDMGKAVNQALTQRKKEKVASGGMLDSAANVATIRRLEHEVSTREAAIERLKAQIANYQRNNTELEKKLSGASNAQAIQVMQNQLKEKGDEVEELRRQNRALETACLHKEKALLAYEKDRELGPEAIRKYEEDIRSLRNRLKDANKAKARDEEAIKRQYEELKVHKVVFDKLHILVQGMEDEDVPDTVDAMLKKFVKMDKELAKHKRMKADYEETVKEKEKLVETLKRKVEIVSHNMERENQRHQTTMKGRDSVLESLTQQMDALNKAKDELMSNPEATVDVATPVPVRSPSPEKKRKSPSPVKSRVSSRAVSNESPEPARKTPPPHSNSAASTSPAPQPEAASSRGSPELLGIGAPRQKSPVASAGGALEKREDARVVPDMTRSNSVSLVVNKSPRSGRRPSQVLWMGYGPGKDTKVGDSPDRSVSPYGQPANSGSSPQGLSGGAIDDASLGPPAVEKSNTSGSRRPSVVLWMGYGPNKGEKVGEGDVSPTEAGTFREGKYSPKLSSANAGSLDHGAAAQSMDPIELEDTVDEDEAMYMEESFDDDGEEFLDANEEV